MSPIKRRRFLQFTGSTLAALGLSELDVLRESDRYIRTLAQSTPRKLALLVGINDYPDIPLQGCATDVNLQRHLLIYRFGFNPNDILTLTNEQATREGILTAFEEHLIKQAKPGDVVVFHFSGHGSQIEDPDCDFSDCLNSTLVPIDAALSFDFLSQENVVPDIMGHTLFLLMEAIPTENVTFILDSCYSGGGTRGNFRVRSRDGGRQLKPIESEIGYQQKWLQTLNLSPEEFKQRRREGVAKGAVIASAKRYQLAADAPFNDFFAGAFTYLMTQYLWQLAGNEAFGRVIPNVARSTARLSFTEQEPLIEYKPGSRYEQRPVYFLDKQTPPAEAVITRVEGNQAELWLGGLNPESLAAFETGAILSVVDAQSQERGRVQLNSREGLIGRASLLDRAQPGAFLQERARGIPTNLTLKIGLDPSLGNDTSRAKETIAAIPRLEALPLQQQEVHYIFGRITPAYRQQFLAAQVADIPAVGSLGLFSPALEIVPDSFGVSGETVAGALKRLRAKFQLLLAARIVKTALNTNSSRLNVVATMYPEGAGRLIASSFTVRGQTRDAAANPPTPATPLNAQKLPIGVPVQLQVTNNEPDPLYLNVLAIDPSGEMSVLFPNQWTADEEVMQIASGQTLKIPDPTKDSFRLVTQEPKGVTEVLILASPTPLREALLTLRRFAELRQRSRGPLSLDASEVSSEPATVVDNLLDDLNNGIRGNVDNIPARESTIRNIDTTQLAALSIAFEVI